MPRLKVMLGSSGHKLVDNITAYFIFLYSFT